MAVESMKNVDSVDTDMNAHTMTVAFDDQKTSLDEIIVALNKAGYTVPSYEKRN